MMADMNIWMVIGFLLAAYSVVANDSLQTLGTYLSSNKQRTPKLMQMAFVCAITIIVLLLGWFQTFLDFLKLSKLFLQSLRHA